MAKAIKQHIINKGNKLVCGLTLNDRIKTAFIDPNDGILYDTDCNPVTHKNMDSICTNCLKLYHPNHYNELIADRKYEAYKESLPKTNRIRARRKAINRRKHNIAIPADPNVIHLPFIPVPITNPRLLLPAPATESKCKVIAKPEKKAKAIKPMPKAKHIPAETIIELTEPVNVPMDDTEAAFIQFNPQLAIVRGFGNFWKVIWMNDDSTIEDLTSWIPYAAAMNEASELAA